MKKTTHTFGFTLIEMLITIAIIGVLASIVYANFGSSRGIARDDIRKTDLNSLKLALALYKAQNGSYPTADPSCSPLAGKWYGRGATSGNFLECDNYIGGLTPDFIAALPQDPKRQGSTYGYYYKSNGTDYKMMARGTVEVNKISISTDDFARCPSWTATNAWCDGVFPGGDDDTTYAVYSSGAKDW